MNTSKVLQLQVANDRLEELVKVYGLNPNLSKYWKDGKLYYSYLTGGGLLASIDTITYNPEYQQLVHAFEKRTGDKVFHVIESGQFLNLLYVSAPDEELSEEEQQETWDFEFIEELNCINAYVINLEEPSLSEYGDIFLGSYQGVLIRTA